MTSPELSATPVMEDSETEFEDTGVPESGLAPPGQKEGHTPTDAAVGAAAAACSAEGPMADAPKAAGPDTEAIDIDRECFEEPLSPDLGTSHGARGSGGAAGEPAAARLRSPADRALPLWLETVMGTQQPLGYGPQPTYAPAADNAYGTQPSTSSLGQDPCEDKLLNILYKADAQSQRPDSASTPEPSAMTSSDKTPPKPDSAPDQSAMASSKNTPPKPASLPAPDQSAAASPEKTPLKPDSLPAPDQSAAASPEKTPLKPDSVPPTDHSATASPEKTTLNRDSEPSPDEASPMSPKKTSANAEAQDEPSHSTDEPQRGPAEDVDTDVDAQPQPQDQSTDELKIEEREPDFTPRKRSSELFPTADAASSSSSRYPKRSSQTPTQTQRTPKRPARRLRSETPDVPSSSPKPRRMNPPSQSDRVKRLKTADIEGDPESTVVAVRQTPSDLQLLLIDSFGNETTLPLSTVRHSHPQALIDYLIPRITIRPRLSQSGGSGSQS